MDIPNPLKTPAHDRPNATPETSTNRPNIISLFFVASNRFHRPSDPGTYEKIKERIVPANKDIVLASTGTSLQFPSPVHFLARNNCLVKGDFIHNRSAIAPPAAAFGRRGVLQSPLLQPPIRTGGRSARGQAGGFVAHYFPESSYSFAIRFSSKGII